VWRLAARAAIRVYQLTASQLLRRAGVRCLHYPSCSEYARMAFNKYPFRAACRLAWQRWRACNPFSGRAYIDWP
jgi:putative component of membrane protein insertase Oxa1/YidC/SpoIIIJ protein YidD